MSTVGASSTNTLSYLQSLLQQGGTKDAKKTAATDPLSMLMQAISGDDEAPAQTSVTASAPAKAGHCQSFSSETMAALLSAQSEPPADSPSAKLFAKLDADGDGRISKTEFGAAAEKAGADSALADAVFAKIDGDSNGAVSATELGKADRGGHRHHHHVESGATSVASAEDVGATATSDVASDSRAESTRSKRAATLLEQLIKLQSQVLNVATSTISAVA